MWNQLNRREFLGRGITGAAGAAMAGAFCRCLPLAAAEAGAAEKPRIHLGTVTYMIGANLDLPSLIEVCERVGIEAVELRTTHKHGVEPTLDAAGRAKVRDVFATTKVKLRCFGTICEFHSPDPKVVRENIEECKSFITLAADLGAWGVKVRPNGLPKDVPVDKTLRQIGESIAKCGEFAKEKGIVVVMEIHGGGTSDVSKSVQIMEACNHPSVGLCWNSNPGDVKGETIRDNFELARKWIRHCHVRDLTKNDYPWKELMTSLKGINYSGYTMLELTTKGDPLQILKVQKDAWEKLVA